MKRSKHLGQSLALGALLLISSLGLIGLMTMQSGALR